MRECAPLDKCRKHGGCSKSILDYYTSEEAGGDCRNSEAPIVAVKSDNSDGAKGYRFEATDKGS